MVPVDEIKLNPNNRNKHPKKQIEQLKKIIEYQGFRRPITISTRSGFVSCGEGRFLAAKKIGMKEIPAMFQDYDDEDQEFADGIADNAIDKQASLDFSAINEDLSNLDPGFDIDWLGIDGFEIDVADKQGNCDDDEIPEKVEPKSKVGDLYQLGEHRLICGDCTDELVISSLIEKDKMDLIFTDPPYGYEYESNHQTKHKMLKNDDKIIDFFKIAFDSLIENSAIYACCSYKTINKWQPLLENFFQYKNLIVWKKNNWSMGDLNSSYAGQHELIMFGNKGRLDLNGERSRDVWEFDRDPPKDHPTQKPVPLIAFALSKSSKKDSKVLDFFGGSGSTLIACEKTNRKCFMSEIDPQFVDVIIARWEKYTGQKAKLIKNILGAK